MQFKENSQQIGMVNEIIMKNVTIDDYLIKIYKSIPLNPQEMFNFLMRKLPSEKSKLNLSEKEREKNKKNHPDYKHLFDYIESIKTQNENYLLSIISIPQCQNNSTGLGNFFGKKMNNISKDLKIFPFGNTIVSNLSLASKRTIDHPTFILLALKGNKHLHDHYPSNPNPIDIHKNTVGYFLMENWCNTICKRYINYLQINGINSCVDTRFIELIKPNLDNEILEKKIDNNIDNVTIDNTNINFDNANINTNFDNANIDNINIELSKILENNKFIFENKYLHYQETINKLKGMIFYLLENKGIINNSIYEKFDINFLYDLFGKDYFLFLQQHDPLS
jgi:hypothetical protein